jgi:hypothetical protein
MNSHQHGSASATNGGKLGAKLSTLARTHDGSSHLPWLTQLKSSLAFHNSPAVQEYGPSVILDQASFMARYLVEYGVADDFMKRELVKEKASRRSAGVIVFNLIMSLLGDEVVQLVEADVDYRILKDLADRTPFELLKIVKGIVTTGITSDVTYQSMINMRNLFDVKQKSTESVRLYVDRIKAAMETFETTSPVGNIFVETDMYYTREKVLSKKDQVEVDAGRMDRPEPHTTKVEAAFLKAVPPESG